MTDTTQTRYLLGMDTKGNALFWHQVEDKVENLNPQALERNYRYVWQYLRSLDESAGDADD